MPGVSGSSLEADLSCSRLAASHRQNPSAWTWLPIHVNGKCGPLAHTKPPSPWSEWGDGCLQGRSRYARKTHRSKWQLDQSQQIPCPRSARHKAAARLDACGWQCGGPMEKCAAFFAGLFIVPSPFPLGKAIHMVLLLSLSTDLLGVCPLPRLEIRGRALASPFVFVFWPGRSSSPFIFLGQCPAQLARKCLGAVQFTDSVDFTS